MLAAIPLLAHRQGFEPPNPNDALRSWLRNLPLEKLAENRWVGHGRPTVAPAIG
jgi:hypothetical protein